MMKMLSIIRIATLFAASILAAQGSPIGQASDANGSVRDLLTSRDWVINSGRGDAMLTFRADGTIEVKGKNRPPTKWTWKIKSDSVLLIDINYQGGYIELDIPPTKDLRFSGHTKKGTPRLMRPVPNRRPEDRVERVGMDTFRTWETVAEQPLMSQSAAVAYINQLTEIVIEKLGANAPAERLDVVVAVRPGKRAKVWLISSLEPPRPREALIKALESVEPFDVRKRPYAFAIYMRVGGAKRAEGFSGPPVPVEWSDAAKRKGGQVKIPDDIIDEIWDTSAAE